MNKKTVRFVTPILATTLVLASLGPAVSVYADETNQNNAESNVSNVDVLTDADILAAGQYISFNTDSGQFVIDDSIMSAFSSEKVKLVEEYVNLTNNQINESKTDLSVVVSAVDPSGQESRLNSSGLLKSAGVNSITYHWNYARIKIKAGSLKTALAVGFTIGTVYAPARIIQLACGLAGLSTTSIKNGVWFDYNYLTGVLCGNAGKQ
ncbi:hypothetical protein HCA78_15060 [Listeria booriae]|uniref:Uncharacterized protein n=1 Tax=Listeria booriae TaxID=1552123 RepID=A0A841ZDV7_9LIST|nr:hypothetical protein [Listeria booriae]MBC1274036.1 hypothetical protein [Listeria booriae]MBC1317944.1 hypothetical protein [Listeria booriae]MBC1511523.1 hypothetical protein [Listeria booriae]MBC1525129.1 hypothetical protein [Listeria booriae]MBC1530714.1 hypothetical protein [Listeria booriae]